MIGRFAGLMLCLLPIGFAGCGNPSAANIALRKQLQQRDDQITTLNRQHDADQADLAARHRPTTTSLSSEKLATLYTTHGLKFGRLTGGLHADSGKPTDEGLKIQIVPIDEDGQPLKSAGTFEVTAFDLQNNGEEIGDWHFDEAATRAQWYGSALLYGYVLPCPWQSNVPVHPDLTVHVTFSDALTGRQFVEQQQVRVNVPPPATAPSTNP